MLYRNVNFYQNHDGLWCWHDRSVGVKSDQAFHSVQDTMRDVDQYLAGQSDFVYVRPMHVPDSLRV